MFAIILDEEKYLKEYSNKYRKPGSIIVDSLPDESDPEKMRCYQHINGEFVLDVDKWAEIEAKREKAAKIESVRREISTLKDTLESSDYQIIKCYEYALNNLELPYDIEQLHAERQALRDQINVLEEQLNT